MNFIDSEQLGMSKVPNDDILKRKKSNQIVLELFKKLKMKEQWPSTIRWLH